MSCSSPDEDPARPIFRGRKLDATADVYSFNTWDDVTWDEERAASVESLIAEQKLKASPPESLLGEVVSGARLRWNWFYQHHTRWFFKDRKWLVSEFQELLDDKVERVWEVGCGAGNSLFPLAKQLPNVLFHACDVSDEAVKLVKEFREFDAARMDAFQWDANCLRLPETIPLGSCDVITCIFVLSALPPSTLPALLKIFYSALKPGGYILIRDYAWGDLAQVRLKPDRLVTADASVYTRGDGTAVHFFTESEFNVLADGLFSVKQNYTDRRLIVNRKRKLEMWRSWLQVKLQRPGNE